MDQTLKQRLIGALVLLSAAIIFLPLVFDGREKHEVYSDIQIPDEPVVTLDVGNPQVDVEKFAAVKEKVETQRAAIAPKEEQLNQVVDTLPTVKPEASAAKQDFAQIKKESEASVPDKEKLTKAYTVQLAAFSSRENAEALYKKLIEKDYKAYLQKGSGGGKTLYRVFVGPQLRENRAALVADALHKEFKLKGMVVRYAP
ncbi:MAG: SPOR domain-containing protein [Pseudomonadales bacterium]|nr:SPOR domain-containing protein [Pseudomonadales bacterium]